jgi:hypothetical protein
MSLLRHNRDMTTTKNKISKAAAKRAVRALRTQSGGPWLVTQTGNIVLGAQCDTWAQSGPFVEADDFQQHLGHTIDEGADYIIARFADLDS